MDLPWPLPHRTDLRDRLLAAYGDGRGYHDRQHLAEVLARVAELGAAEDTEVVLAAWFHDGIYDGEPEPEERSARWAEGELADEDGVSATEVGRLVRLTETHRPADGDRRGEILCDADLAILAAPPERYREYVQGVRAEYADVPEAAFRAGRLAVLKELATKPTLFHTTTARREWEQPARANLAEEIALLTD